MSRIRSHRLRAAVVLLSLLAVAGLARADVKVTADHNDNDHATPEFKFAHVPSPSKDDAATKAKFTIVEGEQDPNGAGLEALHDGLLPSEADEPAANFFFNAGTEGGRIGIDLGSVMPVEQVNTYSWHPNTRGPQVYKVYAADGKAEGFKADPKSGEDPAKLGWRLIAKVDTRPKDGADAGGQYGVSVADDAKKALGEFRYILIDVARTESDDDFGNTFYSEIDVVAAKGQEGGAAAPAGAPASPAK